MEGRPRATAIQSPAVAQGTIETRSGLGRCLAIVPAWNEARAITRVVDDLRALPNVDILVVDDGSSDATGDVARAAGARVVRLPFNVGIGGAVQTGYIAACRDGYSYAVQVDGDGQHIAEEISTLLARQLETGANLVVGTRFGAARDYRAPLARRAGIRLFARVVTKILHVPLTDTTSGFRLADARAIRLFVRAYPHDYPEVESLVVASRAGLRVAETPVRMRHRETGRSSITPIRSGYYMFKVLLAIGMELLRRRPVAQPGEPA